jgi:putative two-component system response regulator
MENHRSTIILVDDNITTLTLGSFTLTEKYDIFTVPSGEKLFKLLEMVTPDLILLDIDMPKMDGYEAIRRLKAVPKTVDIPVIFLSGKNDTGSELEGLSLGAIDYIAKPLSPPLLLKRIELHLLVESQKRALQNCNDKLQRLVAEQTQTLMTLQSSLLKIVADMVEHRDAISGGHIERTRMYLELLLNAMLDQKVYLDEIAAWDKEFLLRSSQLYDLGKIFIKDSILLKPGKLTNEEHNEMKNHVLFGVEILNEIEKHTPALLAETLGQEAYDASPQNDFLGHAKIFAAAHHERWDGAGYPDGLAGRRIPLQGRMMAIADVYDALVSPRPYKTSMTHGEAAAIILNDRGAQFDPTLTDLFAGLSDQFSRVSGLQINKGIKAARVNPELSGYAPAV